MSAIITGMAMPNNCNDCRIVVEKAKTTCKSNGCPLKSIDGLLDYIKHDIANIDDVVIRELDKLKPFYRDRKLKV